MSELKFWIKKIEVKKSQIHGWGVFAKESIQQGEVFECSPVLRTHISRMMSVESMRNPGETVFDDYYFGINDHGIPIAAMGWGYCSLYNHGIEPSAEVGFLQYENKVIGIEYTASRDINPGEEILVNYFGTTEEIEFKNEDREKPLENLNFSV